MLKNLVSIFDIEPKLIFRLDDIAPNMKWDYLMRAKKLFDFYNIKPIIGVIPKNEDSTLKKYPKCNFDFWNKIKELQNEGWEISMHGYEHLYTGNCKKDYCQHGGNTEFAEYSFEDQYEKINNGLKIFKENNITVTSFFAPNHTFDFNTIKACKTLGIKTIIDGYGLKPYLENDTVFFPCLFYKLFSLPVGFQTIQIHLNYFNEEEFVNFENFIKNHNNKFVNFTEVKKIANKSFLNKISRNIIKFSLIYLRKIIVLFNLIKQR